MVSVEKINSSTLHRVYPLPHEHDPIQTEETWSNLFTQPWRGGEDHCGYALIADDVPVGFLGLIFSTRLLDGSVEHMCNITTWVVKEEFRFHHISLMSRVLELTSHTLTDMSSTGGVVRICRRLGFEVLETQLRVLLPVGRVGRTIAKKIRITRDPAEIEAQLGEDDLQRFNDHRASTRCEQLLIGDSGDYCYLIYAKTSNADTPYCHIHYISDARVFARHSLRARAAISEHARTRIAVVDARFLRGHKLPFSSRLPTEFTKLYRSSRLKPEQIDNLYSELTLLDFSTIPTSVKGWRRRLRD